MKSIVLVLACAASLSDQEAKPYQINNDAIGESVPGR